MLSLRPHSLFTLLLVVAVRVSGSSHRKFASNAQADVNGNFTKDSGICETMPGVHQISGYIEVGKNMSMWFWFFESRNAPETAPFTLWLNGGPGCSSMIGLFQENGPCQVNPDGKTTSLNPYSWNNISNMIYIDQPIGAGFSFGSMEANSTDTAAPYVWTALQILFESGEFSKFQSRQFIFATESYGARFGPTFVNYFNDQNLKIDSGELKGSQKIVVSALMINNGRHDPLIQTESYVDFVSNAPGYGPLQNDTVIAALKDAYYGTNGCKAQLEACYSSDGNSRMSNRLCDDADNLCKRTVFSPAVGDRDSDDLRQNSTTSSGAFKFPPTQYLDFLRLPDIKRRIGAQGDYEQCNENVKTTFSLSGEFGRSYLPQLARLADSKFPLLIWVGDADIKCNWVGIHQAMTTMNWYGGKTLLSSPFSDMTIDGTPVATIKNVDNFSFARVFGAGHGLPAFQPKVAFEIFSQVVQKQALHSIPTPTSTPIPTPTPRKSSASTHLLRPWNRSGLLVAVFTSLLHIVADYIKLL